MKIMRTENNVNTKGELLSLLKKYELILTDYTMEYLNSLIELEFSVVRDYISNDARKVLSELEIYKKIAIYNIYYRALNIFKKNETGLEIFVNNDDIKGLSVYAPLREIRAKLFEFEYQEKISYELQSQKAMHIMHIGNISLFQTIENVEQREAELMRLQYRLSRLYNKRISSRSKSRTYGGPALNEKIEHNRKIMEYEKRIQQLNNKKELSDDEKREIEITKQFHELLLEDYGLTNESFEEYNNRSIINSEQDSELKKILIKKQPNLTITDYIEYI